MKKRTSKAEIDLMFDVNPSLFNQNFLLFFFVFILLAFFSERERERERRALSPPKYD